MTGVTLFGRFIHHGAHLRPVRGINNLPHVVEDAHLIDTFLGTDGVYGPVHPLRLILEHVIVDTALDCLTHQIGTENDLLDELISLSINVHRCIDADNQNRDGAHITNQLEAEATV